MNYDDAFKAVIGEEGGYNDDPKDRGNWTGGRVGVGVLKGTKYGVSAMAYPEADIVNMTLDRAKYLFKRDYWDRFNGDNIPGIIAYGMFDAAINEGVRASIRMAQLAVGVAPDGSIGPSTVHALQGADIKQFARKFIIERVFEYATMALWVEDHAGWTGRALDVYTTMIMSNGAN